ncbi:hypothetical protein GCM10009785_10230 [Brooklawnia cerclae]|uniref:Glutathione S-transferase n=1 Tax=Brooklawnia cerclae TaxID=349934 RepID=A0ABX0SLP6_9ACTN|nr:putative glutathione S-transferase [Brooklawnia cerclae]
MRTKTTTASDQDARYIPDDLLRWDLGSRRVLRLADTDEFDEVARVLREAFAAGGGARTGDLAGPGEIEARSATHHVWVAAEPGRVLGAVLTPKPQHHHGPYFTFDALGVGEAGRGLDLDWQLVHHSVELARRWGYEAVEIRSSPQMTAAHALYRRYGFVRRGERETAAADEGPRPCLQPAGAAGRASDQV